MQPTSWIDPATRYYHAVEHLTDFANSHFTDIARREKWIKVQKGELLEGSAQNVLDNIAKLRKLPKNVKKQRTKLLEYYKNNIIEWIISHLVVKDL